RVGVAESGPHRSAGGLVGGRPVFLAEPLHPPGRVHELLLAGEIRVALGANFDVDQGYGRARDEAVAARALDRGPLIRGVNPGFQASHPCLEVERHEAWKYNWHHELAASVRSCAELAADVSLPVPIPEP